MSAPPVRVIVVDDRALLREATTSLLASRDGIVIVDAVASADEALARSGSDPVDVVLLALAGLAADAASATAALRQDRPEVHVVALVGDADDPAAHLVVKAGASACLLETVHPDELVEAIRGVVLGRSSFSRELLPHLTQRAPWTYLTAREREVLALVVGGMTNRAIAQELDLMEHTVRIYVSTILAKLGAANRTEAAVLALRTRIVAPGAAAADRATCGRR